MHRLPQPVRSRSRRVRTHRSRWLTMPAMPVRWNRASLQRHPSGANRTLHSKPPNLRKASASKLQPRLTRQLPHRHFHRHPHRRPHLHSQPSRCAGHRHRPKRRSRLLENGRTLRLPLPPRKRLQYRKRSRKPLQRQLCKCLRRLPRLLKRPLRLTSPLPTPFRSASLSCGPFSAWTAK